MLKEQLQHIIESLSVLQAEYWLLAVVLCATVASLFMEASNRTFALAVMLGITGTLLWLDWHAQPSIAFLGAIAIGKASLKSLLILGTSLALGLDLCAGRPRMSLVQYLLVPILLLGCMLMAISHSLVMLYLSVETASIVAYSLVALEHRKLTSEAALKYLIFGGGSAAFMLYGMTWLYGLSGSIYLPEILAHEAVWSSDMGKIALIMTLGGLLFKISAVPFHIWTPDVYDAAPAPLAALFAIVPKIAGIAILYEITQWIPANFLGQWQQAIGMIALISITLGNLMALKQRSLKRMMAYSAIAQAGFLLVPIASYIPGGQAWQALGFYAAVYLPMNVGVFSLAGWAIHTQGSDDLEQFAGWGRAHALIGIAALIFMASLVGLPPTAGFTGKFLMFSALWESYEATGHTWRAILLLAGLGNAGISLFYYLHLPYQMFFKQPRQAVGLADSQWAMGYIFMLSLALLALFIWPQLLFGILK